ncbi:hypothetical protein SAMN04487895_102248 [Paenibacillus sophorae]|uniref:Uncharacterized protein n=1 Tax=Paenibacillus sophorae TaxID=1333845 RepID=A0A1H8ING4_9BACL|nr:hypothetical protein [Paenibacillus sophorae]QWU16008.1 hypothetical protein KP014_01630 [Paenibacillus sophorae]SEN69566.1 hypothetical protein SAMN04487895_102248 [Paenibacillus sophorae]
MSAYDDFAKEKQEIDDLLLQGYAVTGMLETLDGAKVKFDQGEPGKGSVELLLLTADARKYVTTLVFAGMQKVQ